MTNTNNPWIGSAIDAGSGIIGNAFNMFAVGQQNRYNTEMWNKTNEYNSPKNQVSRMKEAGLNPALMYGSGSSGGGQASPAPLTDKKTVDLSQVGGIIKTYLGLKKMDTDIENTRANTKRTGVLTQGDLIGNELKETEYKYADQLKASQASEAENRDMQTGYEVGKYSKEFLGNSGKIPYWERLERDLAQKDAGTSNLRQQTKSSQLQNWLPAAQKERYQKLGILPEDDGNVQMFKEAYHAITGQKMDSSAAKSPVLGKVLSTIFSKFGKSAGMAKKGTGEADRMVKDFDFWEKHNRAKKFWRQ